MTAREGYMENCHPDKTNVNLGFASVDIGFIGVTSSHNNHYIILNVNKIHRLHYAWFQNHPGQVNIWVCISYSLNSTTPGRIYGEPYMHKFCAVNIFWNITRRQAISPVAKFHHVLGLGFMIQRVKLIFINIP